MSLSDGVNGCLVQDPTRQNGVGSRSLTSSFKIFNTAISASKLDSEKFIAVIREHEDCYDLSNSTLSGNLHKKILGGDCGRNERGRKQMLWILYCQG
jgi:hypothetical protein